MNDSRIIRILKSFSEIEIKSFGKFIDSPFLKPARNTNELYEFLIRHYPGFDSPKLKKEAVFKKLFPGDTFNERKLINLMSDLTKAAEDFLAISAFMKDENDFKLKLSKAYKEKNLYPESMKVLKNVEDKLEPGFSSKKDFTSKFRQLTILKSAFYSKQNDFEKLIECERQIFEVSSVQFIYDFTQLMLLKDPVSITYGKKIENEFIEIITSSFDIENLFGKLQKTGFITKYLIELHYYLIKIIHEPENHEFYFTLRKLLDENISKLDREERYFFLGHLMNYCVRKLDRYVREFIPEGVEVSRRMFEYNAYSPEESEYLDVLTYRNIIQFCLSSKEEEWFEEFIKLHSETLSPEYRNDMKNLAYANFYFMKSEFGKSLNYLSMITNEFFVFKSDLKILLLKVYYELGYTEQAFSLIDTFKHFIRNTKELSGPYKEYYKTFVDYYLSLLKLKSGQGKEDPSFIKSGLVSEKKIVSKTWLIKKAEEL